MKVRAPSSCCMHTGYEAHRNLITETGDRCCACEDGLSDSLASCTPID